MTEAALLQTRKEKFRDPDWTASGERRAHVPLQALRTLWINTGSLCNIECRNCYIESSPENDRLAYIDRAEVSAFLDEIEREALPTREIGFTGGEPFMNPDILAMLGDALARGHSALVLTNAMQPMQRPRIKSGLLGLREAHGARLVIRVSLDHYGKALHEEERGPDTYDKTVEGIDWLARHGFALALAGRTYWGESERSLRDGYGRLARERGWPIDANDPAQLVLFPEMDLRVDVPEITTACWTILHKSPSDVMCASSRMVVKRKGAARPRGAALHAAPLRSCLRDGGDAGRGRARRRRHVRLRRGQALPSALRQVLRARRRIVLGLSTCRVGNGCCPLPTELAASGHASLCPPYGLQSQAKRSTISASRLGWSSDRKCPPSATTSTLAPGIDSTVRCRSSARDQSCSP